MLHHNIEHSLRRLHTDYVDIWQVHSAEPEELAQSDVLETMLRIKEEGKVRHIAVSMSGRATGYGYGQLRPYLDGEWDDFEAIQVWYSALARASEEAMTEAAGRGKGMIVRGVVRRVDPWENLTDATAKLGLDNIRQGDRRKRCSVSSALCPGPPWSAHHHHRHEKSGTPGRQHPLCGGRLFSPDVLVEAKRRLDAAGIVSAS